MNLFQQTRNRPDENMLAYIQLCHFSASSYHMDDQDVPEDARKDQEPKQDRVYSEDLGHGIFHCMADYSSPRCFIEANK